MNVTMPTSPLALAARRHRRWTRARKLVAWTLAVVGVLTVLMGFLHTKAGRPWLMRLAGIAGCPMGQANAAQVDAARRGALAKDRGTQIAPARPALGFALNKTTLAEVRSWAEREHVDCEEERERTIVRCSDVPAPATGRAVELGTMTELLFGFAPHGPLDSVTVLYSRRSAGDASRIARSIESSLTQSLGPPPSRAGAFDNAGTTATLAYRFRDYEAELTMSPVSGSGHVVREAYYASR